MGVIVVARTIIGRIGIFAVAQLVRHRLVLFLRRERVDGCPQGRDLVRRQDDRLASSSPPLGELQYASPAPRWSV